MVISTKKGHSRFIRFALGFGHSVLLYGREVACWSGCLSIVEYVVSSIGGPMLQGRAVSNKCLSTSNLPSLWLPWAQYCAILTIDDIDYCAVNPKTKQMFVLSVD